MSVVEYREYSVLMSVYHKEKPEYLKQAIESIQTQTLSTNDFVLVCDGPLNEQLDDVIATKQQEMGESLNVVRLAKNGGLGNALNEGIKHCKNELVARMDSDDIAYPDRCEKQIAVFNTHSEVSISMIFGIASFIAERVSKENLLKKQTVLLGCYLVGMVLLVGIGAILGLSFFAIKLTLYYKISI